MSAHNKIVQIYKSRLNILSILESTYGYDISDYSGFTFNEVDAMYQNDQLDMLLTDKMVEDKKEPTQKTYIKYHINNALNDQLLRTMVDDLYEFSDTLGDDDCLFIVYDGEPNDSLVQSITQWYNNSKKFIIVYNIKRLQFNILEHSLVPKVSILEPSEVEDFKKKYNVTTVNTVSFLLHIVHM